MHIPIEFLILPFFAFLCYWPAINGSFVFDDRDAVLHNESVTNGNWRQQLRSPWRGLTLCTYALQCLWPKTSRSFRIVNILIHAVNGWIFQRILLTLGYGLETADRGAILYICLPFAANAVCYIAGRAAILSATFGMLGVWFLLAGYPAVVPLCLLWAIFAKEDGAGYTLTFAAVHAWTGSPWFWLWLVLPPIAWILPRWSWLPTFITALNWRHILALARNKGDSNMRRGGLPGNLPQPEHALTVFVLSVIFVPCWALGLCQAPYQGSGAKVRRGWPLLALLIIFILAGLFIVLPDVRLPLLLIAIGPWLLYLAIPSPDQLIEYRYYSCLAGLALLATMALASSGSLAWAGVIAYSASNTAWQAHAWSTGKRFWTACIYRGQGESSRAWQELGAEHKNAAEYADAEACFHRALDINPNLAPAMRNLGWIWAEQNKLADAVALLKTCTERCPEHPHAWEEYGYILEMAHQPGEAETAFRHMLELEPASVFAHMRLGLLLYARQSYDEAVDMMRFPFEVQPTPITRWNLSWALKMAGRTAEARDLMKGMPPEIQMTSDMVMPPQAEMKAVTA